MIGGSGTDCLTLVSRNVAEARVATVFYFLQHGQDKSTAKFLMRLSLGSGGRFIEREGVSTLSIHGYPWALRYLLIVFSKLSVLLFNVGLKKVSLKNFSSTRTSECLKNLL